MDERFNLDYFRLNGKNWEFQSTKVNRLPRHKPGEKFLKGPIPMGWLDSAGKLPGKALHVGIMLWYLGGLRKTNEVNLSLSGMFSLGLTRWSARRGLFCLERTGLVAVKRRIGMKPLVTILAGNSSCVEPEEPR